MLTEYYVYIHTQKCFSFFLLIHSDHTYRNTGGAAFLQDFFAMDIKEIFPYDFCKAMSLFKKAIIIGLYRPPEATTTIKEYLSVF